MSLEQGIAGGPEKCIYPCAVHKVINALEFADRLLDHGFDAGLVGGVHLDGRCCEVLMASDLLALRHYLFGSLHIDVRKSHMFGACFSKG